MKGNDIDKEPTNGTNTYISHKYSYKKQIKYGDKITIICSICNYIQERRTLFLHRM